MQEFDFKVCPFCGADYKDGQVLKVVNDQLGPCRLFIHCDQCGTTYSAERQIVWQVEKVADGKPLSQEVAEFLEDRTERIEKARHGHS